MPPRHILVTALVVGACATVALAAEFMGVPGSAVQYPTRIDARVEGKAVPMTLTGAALRKKLLFNVYAIGSYVEEGAKVKTAEELAAADVPKVLHVVMERDLDGKEFAQAFQEAVRLNYAAPAFEAEIKSLSDVLKAKALKKGDQLHLVHVPGVGLECVLNGKTEAVIRSVPFALAVWEIYLGPKNISPEIKAMLTARL